MAAREDTVTIACVNFKTEWGNKPANLEKMKSFVLQAARQGTDLVVFPEMALSGYECDEEDCTMHPGAAETIPGPSSEEMARLAREEDLYVIFGMPERDKKDAAVRYNAAVVIGPEGILGTYRKLNLGTPPLFTEWKCFTRGRELPVFKTRHGVIGVQICYDFWIFPELTRILVLKGAEIIINTSASPSGPGKPYFFIQQTGARAIENRVFTVSANLVGQERKKSFFGHSLIAGPAPPKPVTLYAQAGAEEEMVSATLNLKQLRFWQTQSTWQQDWPGEIILSELGKIVQKPG